MDLTKKKVSLKFRLMKEFDSILRHQESQSTFPAVTRRNEISKYGSTFNFRMPSIQTAAFKGLSKSMSNLGPKYGTRQNVPTTATNLSICTVQTNPRNLSPPYMPVADQSPYSSVTAQLGQTSITNINARKASAVRSVETAITIPTLNGTPQPFQKARRVTERVKSIKRHPPLQKRSSSIFYIEVGEEVTASSVPQSNDRRRTHVQRSVSVDDLLDITHSDTEEMSQASEVLVPANVAPDGTGDLIEFTSEFGPEVYNPQLQVTNESHSEPNNVIEIPSTNLAPFSRELVEVVVHMEPVDTLEPVSTTVTNGISGHSHEAPEIEVVDAEHQLNIELVSNDLSSLELSPPTSTIASRRDFCTSRSAHLFTSTQSLDSVLDSASETRQNVVHENLSRRFSIADTIETSTQGQSEFCSDQSMSTSSLPFASSSQIDLTRATTAGSGVDTLMSYDTTLDGLKLREKVVWFTDKDVPEIGTIKWLGKLDGKHFVGVEFDNHVGNTSGKWRGRRLFTTPLTRGRFVAINEILLYSDFRRGAPCNKPAKINYPSWEKPKRENSTMAIICVICQDSLVAGDFENGDVEDEQEDMENAPKTDKEMVTTMCGHLFHHSCLNKWFNIKRKPIQPCPYCQRSLNISDVIRIFPVQGK